MAKLKCWKKDKAGWHKEHLSGRLKGGSLPGWVYIYPKGKFRDRENEVIISTSEGNYQKDRKDVGFKTKKEAIRFANKYMKKHDKC